MIVAMAGTDPDLAAKAILAAQQDRCYFHSVQVSWTSTTAAAEFDGARDKRAHQGRAASLRIHRSFLSKYSWLNVPARSLDELQIDKMKVPSSGLALLRMTERSIEEQQQQIAFMGHIGTAKDLWQVAIYSRVQRLQ